jgi:D-3-phosphoglycerate dehydrogenase
MTEKQILVTLATNTKEALHDYMQERMDSQGYRLKAVYNDEPLTKEELKEALQDVDGYIVALETVDAEILDAAAGLKAISKYGVGVDNIDLAAARAKGVEVSNCPGSNSNAVAELTIGLMISMARNIQTLCNNLRDKRWTVEVGLEVSGKKVGILGFGNVGRRVAHYLKAFGAEVLVYDLFKDPKAAAEYDVRYTSVEEIARTSDFITVHLPMLDDTRHLINAEMFSIMKTGVFLVNAARGGVVDENALYNAVIEGKVAGAAVDVFEFEPPTASKLLTDERFIVLPHIGAATKQASLNMMSMAMDNVIAVLEGRANPHPVS